MWPSFEMNHAFSITSDSSGTFSITTEPHTNQIKANGHYFTNQDGATYLLRGFNVSGHAKNPPFVPLVKDGYVGDGTVPTTTFPKPDLTLLDPLMDLGSNVIRLTFIWEAFEPVMGQYQWDYLESLRMIIDGAYDRGMFTILDIHQDALSRYAAPGCGDGFPKWTISSKLQVKSLIECNRNWGITSNISPKLHRAFSEFYANKNGVKDAFLQMLDHVSKAFAYSKGLIGYDLLNEPWGNELKEIKPLYEREARIIRKNAPKTVLFFQPQVSIVMGQTKSKFTKLDKEKDGFLSIGNIAYIPHFYDLVAALTGWWGDALKGNSKRAFAKLEESAKNMNVPLFVGEFGAINESRFSVEFAQYQYFLLDYYFASATQWSYTPEWTPNRKDGWNQESLSIVNDKGELFDNYARRPFPQVTSGTPIHFYAKAFMPKLGQMPNLKYRWMNKPETGKTIIYFPDLKKNLESRKINIDTKGKNLICETIELQKLQCSSLSASEMEITISSY